MLFPPFFHSVSLFLSFFLSLSLLLEMGPIRLRTLPSILGPNRPFGPVRLPNLTTRLGDELCRFGPESGRDAAYSVAPYP